MMGYIGQSLLNLIRSCYVLLLQISHTLPYVVRAVTPWDGTYRAENLEGLAPTTVKIYQGAVNQFLQWLTSERRFPFFPHEFDVAILDYVGRQRTNSWCLFA